MKTHFRAAILAIAALPSLVAVPAVCADTTVDQPARAASFSNAPADEYFGPLALSVLGIRNAIGTTTLRLDRAGAVGPDAVKSVALVEESIREWQAKYPDDAWLPRMVLALHHAYREIATDESRRRSVDTATWLISRYPSSAEAAEARGELADAISIPAPQLDAPRSLALVPPPLAPPPEPVATLPPYAHY
jgi:hypothetical protein